MNVEQIKTALQADVEQYDSDGSTYEVGEVIPFEGDYIATVWCEWPATSDEWEDHPAGEQDYEVTVEVKDGKVTHDFASCLESGASEAAADAYTRRAEAGFPDA